MADITSLGIGKTMRKKLHSVGIDSAEEPTRLGSMETIKLLKRAYPGTCVTILYHLEAAIEKVDMKRIPVERKEELKHFFKTM